MLIILSDLFGNVNMSECFKEFFEKGWIDFVFYIFLQFKRLFGDRFKI